MEEKHFILIVACCLFSILFLQGCSIKIKENRDIEKERLAEIEFPIQYDVKHLYVTVLRQSATDGKQYQYTFDELNDMNEDDSFKNDPRFKVILQEGTEEGPEEGLFGFGETSFNAVLEMRGNTSRSSPQKSYKIKLNNDAGQWESQKVLNLNKHVEDFTRVRNKLSFDYFTLIPDLVSLRTQFIHLHVRDLSSEKNENGFSDYGLYTHIEQANKEFLKSRRMDPNGNFYKVNAFAFYRYPEQLKLVTDSDYSKEEFEKVLKIKGSNDHRKLLNMLDETNDPTLNFNEVFQKHFDEENYLTWMAVNILFGNYDTVHLNFYLYSPSFSKKWYLLPWDYDRGWGNFKYYANTLQPIAPWQDGLANWWSVDFHRRYFEIPGNIDKLTKKINELSSVINGKQTAELLDAYYKIVRKHVSNPPDLIHLPINIKSFDQEYRSLAGMTDYYKQNYLKKLELPMPIRLGIPEFSENEIAFVWNNSYDYHGDTLLYDFQVSKTPDFMNIYYEAKNIEVTRHQIERPPRGEYYWRVIVRDSNRNTQIALGYFFDGEKRFYGVEQFKVEIN